MSYLCFSCSQVLEPGDANSVGRRDTCPKCGSDLHCCRNCSFHDPRAYNECKEPQADRVLEKDRSNFCDFFRLNPTAKPGAAKVDPREAAKKRLDDLFKK